MANAIKKVSVQRGHDVTDYALNCFGGAGGQHACLVADELGIETVLIHPFAGVLSAYGMGLADVTALHEFALEKTLDAALIDELRDQFENTVTIARQELTDQGIDASAMQISRKVQCKYAGTDTPLLIDYDRLDAMKEAFAKAHRQQFGFVMDERDLVVEAGVVEAVGKARAVPTEPEADFDSPSSAKPATTVQTFNGLADSSRHPGLPARWTEARAGT